MALTPPTATEQTEIDKQKALADASVIFYTKNRDVIEPAKRARIQLVEAFLKVRFGELNDDVIRKYEAEVRWMNGTDIAAPIVEADLLDFVLRIGRLVNGSSEIPLRRAEFDGSPLVSVGDDQDETNQITLQERVISLIQIGVSTASLTNGVTTASLNSASTTGQVDSDITGELNDNDLLLITTGSDVALVEVDNVVETGAGPFTYDFDIIDFQIVPSSTISSAADAGIETFAGFNNTERTNKSAAPAFRQAALDNLLNQLQSNFDTRKTALINGKSAVDSNIGGETDPLHPALLATAITSLNTLLGGSPPSSIDVSDTGITAIDAEKVTRLAQIPTRISDIADEIIAGDFYDLRFDATNNRVNHNNGTLEQIKLLGERITQMGLNVTTAGDLSSRYSAYSA